MNIVYIIFAFFIGVIVLFKNISFVIFYAPVVKPLFVLFSRIGGAKNVVVHNMNNNVTNSISNVAPNAFTKPKVLRSVKHILQSFTAYYLYRLSLTPSHHIRNLIYRRICGLNLAKHTVIYYGAEIRSPHKIQIGKGSVIGDNAILDGRNGIIIGENVVFASNVHIWTQQHDHRDPWFRCETQKHFPVTIGDRAWIGPNTIILHSVQIGEGAVVAAGAVVTHNIPPFAIVAGVPAKVIGERNHDLKYIFDGSHRAFL